MFCFRDLSIALAALVFSPLSAAYTSADELAPKALESATGGASYVGSQACADCHQQQYQDWQGSHHERAMDHATDKSVRGDFNNAKARFKDQPARFFKKGDEFWANLVGEDGTAKDYQIKFTFGYEPLQQYMVAFDDGRVQLIPYAWDTRPKAEGGQRWFYLSPDHSEPHQEFFWTNPGQNWNYMCADCHSTNVKKNFDLKTNSYNTTYDEITVGCEACHGPASAHMDLVAKPGDKHNRQQKPKQGAGPMGVDRTGFTRVLTKAVDQWLLKENAATASPKDINHTDQTLVCAQCHSRHVQISDDDYVSSAQLGNRYMLTLIDGGHYYPDGQVFDEDYVYGSFLQSKMSEKGVVCSNCHNPHSAKLTIPKETVCLQCHQASTYAQESHHHHPADSDGAQCVNCHMPETTYMQVDPRRDHRWHIPNSKNSLKHGTPDACLSCHTDKDSHWSDGVTQSWKPAAKAQGGVDDKSNFAPVFAAADLGYQGTGYQGIAQALSHIAQDHTQRDIIRASALERMVNHVDTNSLIATARGAKDDSEYIRLGAVRGAANLPAAERWRIVSPLLTDPVLVIRTEATAVLLPLWQELTGAQRRMMNPAIDEYLEVQAFNADRGSAHTNIGNVYMHKGQLAKAQGAYQQAIRIEPIFDQSYLYLADSYRQQGNELEAAKVLNAGQKANPDSGQFPYQLGMGKIRQKDYSAAANYFKQAAAIDDQNPQFFYVLGLTLESSDPQAAADALRKTYNLSQNPQHLYALCELSLRNQLANAQACLSELTPQVPANVIEQLKRQY